MSAANMLPDVAAICRWHSLVVRANVQGSKDLVVAVARSERKSSMNGSLSSDAS